MQDETVEVMLTEYRVLRNELYKIYDLQIKILAIVGSTLGVLYGILYQYQDARIIILLIPIILFPLGLKFQYNSMGAVYLSKYLEEELEVELKKKMKNTNWRGYQNYYMEKWRKLSKDIIFDGLPKWLIFIAIPMWIAFWFSYNDSTYNEYDWLGWIYLILSIAILTLYGYLWYKEYKELKEGEDKEMGKKTKSFFEKPSTQKALVISFMVALILIAIEAIRYVIEVIVDIVFYGYTIDTVIDSYGYLTGLVVAIIILILFLMKYKEVLEK